MTADADAFIMTSEITSPLTRRGNATKIWIYRYELSLGSGYTFMMPFLAARAKTWKQILIPVDEARPTPEWLVDTSKKAMNFSDSYTWDIDQHIVSRAILASGFCSLPRDNKLWKEVKLKPRSVVAIQWNPGKATHLGRTSFVVLSRLSYEAISAMLEK